MKKIFLTALAVFAFGSVSAQEVTFGAKAGVNFSNFSGDADLDGTTGFYVGGLADISFSESFSFQPELLYSIEGAKDASLSYLRLPLMAKYNLSESFSLLAGPNIGFLMGGDEAIKDAAKSLDYGLGLGTMYKLESGLFFEARYNLGLANINDDENDIDIKNTNIAVGLGYRF